MADKEIKSMGSFGGSEKGEVSTRGMAQETAKAELEKEQAEKGKKKGTDADDG